MGPTEGRPLRGNRMSHNDVPPGLENFTGSSLLVRGLEDWDLIEDVIHWLMNQHDPPLEFYMQPRGYQPGVLPIPLQNPLDDPKHYPRKFAESYVVWRLKRNRLRRENPGPYRAHPDAVDQGYVISFHRGFPQYITHLVCGAASWDSRDIAIRYCGRCHVLMDVYGFDAADMVLWPAVHILNMGFPLCGFSRAMPADWPEGHTWVGYNDDYRPVTCSTCLQRGREQP